MATTIDFPNSPTSGQTYTYSGVTYQWNTVYWAVYNQIEPSIVSDTVPTGSTKNGFFWINPTNGKIYTYYSGAWAQFIKDGTDGTDGVDAVIPSTLSLNILNVSGSTNLNTLSVSGSTNLNTLTATGTTSIQQILEKASIILTPLSGATNYNVLTQAVGYYVSGSTGNWTMNIRGNSGTTLNSLMSIGQSLTVVVLATQGATPYYCTAITIDGGAITPKWQGGTAPTSGNASAIDIYSYIIIKTAASTYTVLASQIKFS